VEGGGSGDKAGYVCAGTAAGEGAPSGRECKQNGRAGSLHAHLSAKASSGRSLVTLAGLGLLIRDKFSGKHVIPTLHQGRRSHTGD
jgi:hypothetical protein